MLQQFFLQTPLWGIFLFTVIIVLTAFEAGMLLGKKHKQTPIKENIAPISSIIGATLGLLAFLLAFTFGMSASKLDERRMLVIDEANAINTLYLRSEYLEDPYKTEIQKLIKEYVTLRLKAIQLKHVDEGLKISTELQNLLWAQAVAVAQKNPNSNIVGLFIKSLNDVFELHTKRVNIGIYLRMPMIIWITLYFVAILSISSLGYQFGLTHTRHLGITLLLIFTFSVVILLIVDLDRPQQGFIKVSQQSLIDLQNKFNQRS